MYKIECTGKWFQGKSKNPLWPRAGLIPWCSSTLEPLLRYTLNDFFDNINIFIEDFPDEATARTIIKKHYRGPDSRGVYPEIICVQIKHSAVRGELLQSVG